MSLGRLTTRTRTCQQHSALARHPLRTVQGPGPASWVLTRAKRSTIRLSGFAGRTSILAGTLGSSERTVSVPASCRGKHSTTWVRSGTTTTSLALARLSSRIGYAATALSTRLCRRTGDKQRRYRNSLASQCPTSLSGSSSCRPVKPTSQTSERPTFRWLSVSAWSRTDQELPEWSR